MSNLIIDAEGCYKAFRMPLPDLLTGQGAVMIMEEGEVLEQFYRTSTPTCDGDDTGLSQVLRGRLEIDRTKCNLLFRLAS